jgi:hypothetical protein
VDRFSRDYCAGEKAPPTAQIRLTEKAKVATPKDAAF